jgi:hypothetical protein
MLKKAYLLLVIFSMLIPITVSYSQEHLNEPAKYFKKDINTAISMNLIPKNMKGQYNKNITKQEFCYLIYNLCKYLNSKGIADSLEDNVKNRKFDFDKVRFTDTNDMNVRLCAYLGISEPKSKELYDPKSEVSRQVATKMLYKTAESVSFVITDEFSHRSILPSTFPHIFKDGKYISYSLRDYVFWAYHKGIMNGTSKYRFSPKSMLTREQAYAIIIRLYNVLSGNISLNKMTLEYYPSDNGYVDMYKNIYTKEEKGHIYPFDEKYSIVVDNEGVGVSLSHIIDKKGNTMLKNLGQNGLFRQIILDRNLANVVCDDCFYTVNLDTGEKYKNLLFEKLLENRRVVSYRQTKYGYLDEKGKLIMKLNFKYAGDFNGGKAIIKNDKNENVLINKDGKILKKFSFSSRDYHVTKSYGENCIVIDNKDKYAIYKTSKGFLTKFEYDNISFCTNGQFIAGKDGCYKILNQYGKIISKIYKNRLEEVDTNRYLGWISYKNQEYALIDENGKELTTIKFSGSILSLFSDGEGLYLYQASNNSCVVIDYYGNKLSTITREYSIGVYMFVNGLICIGNNTGLTDNNGKNLPLNKMYYLPNGEKFLF